MNSPVGLIEKIRHPKSNREIVGVRLIPGEKLEPSDVYDSTGGLWELCPCPGLEIEPGAETIWVRPFFKAK